MTRKPPVYQHYNSISEKKEIKKEKKDNVTTYKSIYAIDNLKAIETSKQKQPLSEEKWISSK